MGRVYISGAITNNPAAALDFKDAETYLLEQGFEVINPQRVLSGLPESFTHKDYMDICLPMLDKANGIYMLKNWKESTGACIEYGYALGTDKIMLYEEEYK